MKISRSFALAIIVGTGIGGAFIGRAARNDAPHMQADISVSPALSGTTPAECGAERSALAVMKAQLSTCMTIGTKAPEIAPSAVPEKSEPDPPAFITDEVKSYRERLESLPEAVIVRHSTGTVRVYKLEEWPPDGDGVIIGRKFMDGRIERYPFGVRPSAPH
jgi:hypothetical protein